MKRNVDADLNLGERVPLKADGLDVRVSVVGFAVLYAAALELPIGRLQKDPSWCVEHLKTDSLAVDVF